MYARLETSPQDAIGNFGMKLATFLTWCAMNNKIPIIDDAFQKYGRDIALKPTIGYGGLRCHQRRIVH